ncbi:MAG: hypothetical protein M3O70_04795 [Actinomycetota bacterium]|nr:hypothetical protein [Actinomycetota bacterium]
MPDSHKTPAASHGDQAKLRLATTKACWGAVAALTTDRATAAARLHACFCAGEAPEALDGRTSGQFLTTTLGAGVDQLFQPLARIWMPWKGKIFDATGASGWNWFADSARGVVRLFFPNYEGVSDDHAGTFTAFRFRTTPARSQLLADVEVLRIDYDLPENPSWPVRQIVDELVRIGDGTYLGQALLRRGKGWVRVGWFALEDYETHQ